MLQKESMSIFNSLGSNYNLSFAWQALTAISDKKHRSELEKMLANKYQGQVILLYKCREAISLALKILDLPKESFVAINGFTCFAVYEAIKNVGLNIEYPDIEKSDINFAPQTLKNALKKNPKIKAVIIQNTLGFPCQIKEIAKICQENKVILIEDLAHSVGAKYQNGKEAGTLGDFTVLSFSQDKIVDGISGGALIIRNSRYQSSEALSNISTTQQLTDRFYPLFTYLIRTGHPFGLGKIIHKFLKTLNLLSKPMDGGSGKFHQLPSWYCQIIKSQFEKLEQDLKHRRGMAQVYASQLNPTVLSKSITQTISSSSNLRFPIFTKNRKGLINYLRNHGIFVSDIWYDAPISPKKYLGKTDYNNQCPNSEVLSSKILNLPTHINVSETDAKKLSSLVNQWLKSQ